MAVSVFAELLSLLVVVVLLEVVAAAVEESLFVVAEVVVSLLDPLFVLLSELVGGVPLPLVGGVPVGGVPLPFAGGVPLGLEGGVPLGLTLPELPDFCGGVCDFEVLPESVDDLLSEVPDCAGGCPSAVPEPDVSVFAAVPTLAVIFSELTD